MVSWRQRVRDLEAENKFLREKLVEFEHLLKAYENAHTPSSKKRKKNTQRDESKPRFPGKPPESSGGGIELPPPDEVKEHKLDACPAGHKLKLIGMRKHTMIDFPEKPLIVTEHNICQYYCPKCRKNIEAAVPNGIYGPYLRSFVVMLKNMTNSSEKIASFIRELGAPSFSCAQVQRIIDEFSNKLEPKRQQFLEQLRAAPYIHADETSFRKDGKNGWVWGVFTSRISLFSAALSRGRENIKALLGNYKGILVVDGYNAYNEFKLKQRCWAHLLREFKEYAETDPEIDIQYARAKLLHEQLKKLKEKPPNEEEIEEAHNVLADIIICLNVIKSGRKLATLIENGGGDWFTALRYPDVPLDNNCAERGLRSVVLHRKMMGCYRNDKGKRFFDIVVSVLQTWKLMGINLFKMLSSIAKAT